MHILESPIERWNSRMVTYTIVPKIDPVSPYLSHRQFGRPMLRWDINLRKFCADTWSAMCDQHCGNVLSTIDPTFVNEHDFVTFMCDMNELT